jgi:hypothetical protein
VKKRLSSAKVGSSTLPPLAILLDVAEQGPLHVIEQRRSPPV